MTIRNRFIIGALGAAIVLGGYGCDDNSGAAAKKIAENGTAFTSLAEDSNNTIIRKMMDFLLNLNDNDRVNCTYAMHIISSHYPAPKAMAKEISGKNAAEIIAFARSIATRKEERNLGKTLALPEPGRAKLAERIKQQLEVRLDILRSIPNGEDIHMSQAPAFDFSSVENTSEIQP